MVERNPVAAIWTNAIGTRHVCDAAVSGGCRAMVLISTDKLNPTNVMGASKRCAEGYCQALALAHAGQPAATHFEVVRFGNVLGSSGSVVPLFERQLKAGGPLTVTHPDIERYFMTIREAVQLVLQASALGVADSALVGRVFVLDMGTPVKIADLARQLRLAGLQPEKDVAIKFTGLRPGEKLYEELFHSGERIEPTDVPASTSPAREYPLVCRRCPWSSMPWNRRASMGRRTTRSGPCGKLCRSMQRLHGRRLQHCGEQHQRCRWLLRLGRWRGD